MEQDDILTEVLTLEELKKLRAKEQPRPKRTTLFYFVYPFFFENFFSPVEAILLMYILIMWGAYKNPVVFLMFFPYMLLTFAKSRWQRGL